MTVSSRQKPQSDVMVSSARILLVDATGPYQESTAQLLREAGYGCDAVDTEGGRELLASRQYDLLVTDINLPGGSGVEFIKHAHASVPGLQVIVVTDCPSLESAIQAVELPVVAYLLKSDPVHLLRERIRTTLRDGAVGRALSRIQNRLRHCADDLGDVAATCRAGAPDDVHGDTLVPISTLQALAGCLGELVAMEAGADADGQVTRFCELLQCPVWRVQRNAIQKCILLLHETKRRFKSKELALVRETLEHLQRTLA